MPFRIKTAQKLMINPPIKNEKKAMLRARFLFLLSLFFITLPSFMASSAVTAAPASTENTAADSGANTATNPGASTAEKEVEPAGDMSARDVNINTADPSLLADRLVGVGLKKAEAIVAFRTEHGAFENVDDLLDVPGIGPATLEKNRAHIVVE